MVAPRDGVCMRGGHHPSTHPSIHPPIHVVIGMSGQFAPHHATEAKPTEDRTHHIDQPQTVRQTVSRTDKQRERERAPPAR